MSAEPVTTLVEVKSSETTTAAASATEVIVLEQVFLPTRGDVFPITAQILPAVLPADTSPEIIDTKGYEAQHLFEVDRWRGNAQAIRLHNNNMSWVTALSNGYSYNLPFPTDDKGTNNITTFSGAPHVVLVNFPLSQASTRLLDVLGAGGSGLMKTVTIQELAAGCPELKNVVSRTDYHLALHRVVLLGYTTQGVPFPMTAAAASWVGNSASASGSLVDLPYPHYRKRKGEVMATWSRNPDVAAHACVLKPDARHFHDCCHTLYELNHSYFSDPWVSRGLQVDFKRLREALDTFDHPESAYKAAGVLRVAGPGPEEVPIVDNLVTWLIMWFWPYIAQESKALLTKTAGLDAEVLRVDAGHLYFIVSKRALLEVIGKWQKQTHQHHILQNARLLAIRFTPLEREEMLKQYHVRANLIENQRDQLEANPFVSASARVAFEFWPFPTDMTVSPPALSDYTAAETKTAIDVKVDML